MHVAIARATRQRIGAARVTTKNPPPYERECGLERNTKMDLSSRWDRAFLSLLLFLCLITMSGCAALSNGSTISNGAVTVATTNMNFGTVVVGSSKQLTDRVTNRSRYPVTIVSATASNSSFSVKSPSLPVTIAPGQSTILTIAFTPQATGNPAGRIVVMSGDARTGRAYISVSGSAIGAGKVDLSPSALSFGSVAVGQSIAKRVTITNSGSTSVVLSQDSTSSSAYTVSGLTLPATIAPGQTASLSVTFAPKSVGSVDGNVTLNGNASLVVSGAAGSSTPTSQAINAILQVSGSGIGAAQIAASPSSVAFGNVTIGTPQSTTITLTNSGTASETISQASASGVGFSISGLTVPISLAAGQSTTFTATYAPTAAGTLTGGVVISTTGGNASLNIPASGTGVTPGALSATPTSIAFGSIAVGATQSLSETLRNTGGSLLHITAATITGTGFGNSGITVPTSLNPGQSLTFNVSFSPSSGGAASGSLALTADGSVPSLTIALTGSGTAPGQLSLTPSSANFGNVTVGVTQTQSATLTASGGAVTVSATSSTNPEFGISGLSLPLNLTAGQSASFNLTFTPQASGAASGAITLTTNASNAPLSGSLTGTGVAAPQHSVTLAWNASTSTVVGYNVYRGTQSGGPYSVITSGPDSNTSYTDSLVQAGQTYYYVVTAVDSSGNESVNSNQAQAVIPTP